MTRVFYSFPRHLRADNPREIHIPIMGRITAQSITEEAHDILTAPPSMAIMVVPGSDMEQGSAIQYAVGRIIGDAMARIQDRQLQYLISDLEDQLIINQFGFGWPSFRDEEEMREWYRRLGIEMQEPLPMPSFIGQTTLLNEATTLRQRCFARLFRGYNKDTKQLSLSHCDVKGRGVKIITKGVRGMMAACYRDKEIRAALRKLPISKGPSSPNGNPELVDALQELADIVAQEIRAAYEDDYYPGIPDVDPLTDEHVEQVMTAMQREIDREQRLLYLGDGDYRNKTTAHLPDLPKERKTALAERRRHWFGVFGITPESWKKGTWDLWKVKSIPFPDGYRRLG